MTGWTEICLPARRCDRDLEMNPAFAPQGTLVTRLAWPLDASQFRWSGWLLVFRRVAAVPYPSLVGWRILLACLFLEGIARPVARAALPLLGLAGSEFGRLALVVTMLALAVGVTALWIRLPFSQVGLRRWDEWGNAEKWFFPQIIAVSVLVFILTEQSELAALPKHAGWIRATTVVFVGQMIWGFYQEYVYRGLLQTELARRWGAAKGILASNLLFTFGPLHWYHFSNSWEHPGQLLIFPAIFAIGLYFGVLFYRSGNLWIIGVAHGIGDFFVDGIGLLK